MSPRFGRSTMLMIVTILGVIISVLTVAPIDSLYGAIMLITGAIFFYLWKKRTPERTVYRGPVVSSVI